MLFADIAFPIALREVFTYAVPDEIAPFLKPGMRVFVSFQSRKKVGMTVRLHNTAPVFKTKPVEALIDTEPVMNAQLLDVADWMARYYFCGIGECFDAMMPVGLQVDSIMTLVLSEAAQELTEAPWDLVKRVFEAEEQVRLTSLMNRTQVSENWIFKQIKAGLMLRDFQPENRMKAPVYERYHATSLFTADGLMEGVKTKKKPPLWARQALDLLEQNVLPATGDEIRSLGIESATLKRLSETGYLVLKPYEPEFRIHADAETRLNDLNDGQLDAYEPIHNALAAGSFASFLLKGITGSGKTELYLHALAETLKAGRSGIILVPEIALTPQTVRRFRNVFGDGIAVLHSRLSNRERIVEWEHLRAGRKRIVIGARSAVFAPLENPGLIVIDEEHDASFKQADPAPRYHAREVALMRAKASGAVVILGSATPSLNSLDAARRGKAELLTLTGRHGTAKLPPVTVLDLKLYKNSGMHGPLAAPLFLAAEEALGVGDQVIFLHNRRGFSSFLQCEACGDIPGCPHCSVSLTFHKTHNQLRCHYCGFTKTAISLCGKCGNPHFLQQGTGTQQVEEELQKLFPGVAMLRFDLDTIGGKNAHEEILGKFSRGEAQILVGTQLVTKGLDFPDVTVVGVINADTELAFPSYRVNERWFQMLSQVAGRAGRAQKPGNVYIQTRKADAEVIRFAAKHDYDRFAAFELEQREMLWYPPFSRLLRLELKDKHAQKPPLAGERLAQVMVKAFPNVPVLGPTASALYRRADFFYWELLAKLPVSASANQIEHYLTTVFEAYAKSKPTELNSVSVYPVIDPVN